jgi:signal transduction histidine kinase
VRLRLTLLYGALFLVAGTLLLAITYELVANSIGGGRSVLLSARAPHSNAVVQLRAKSVSAAVYLGGKTSPVAKSALIPSLPTQLPLPLRHLAFDLQVQAQNTISQQRQDELDALITRSGVALGIMAFVSIGLGWLMAGRALRPVRTMNARARGISERNLHERLALEGPDDELKELGDTFDGLLARLEMAFESQRRFVANASHELRTPITLERTLVEVALADPGATVGNLRGTCARVLLASEEQERLIEALLTLARSQRGLESRQELDLAEVVADVVRGVHSHNVRVEPLLEEARTTGDVALVERLAVNLIDNAVLHNQPGGWVQIWTGVRAGAPTLEVTNSGPLVGADQAPELLEPFHRLAGERAGRHAGLGLGLSIVDAIARAHDARLSLVARSEGGLSIEVIFRAASADLAPFYTDKHDVSALGRVGDPGRAHR